MVRPPAMGQAAGGDGTDGMMARGSLAGGHVQQPWLVRYQRRSLPQCKVRVRSASTPYT